jgi:hypothetical protein
MHGSLGASDVENVLDSTATGLRLRWVPVTADASVGYW